MSPIIRAQSFVIMVALSATPVISQGKDKEKDKDNAFEKEIKANLKDETKPFTLMVSVKVKDGKGEKFEAAFAKARTATRKEKGNRAYNLNRSTKNPNEYVVYERWDNFASVQAHLKAAHTKTLLTEIGELLAGAPELRVFIPTRE